MSQTQFEEAIKLIDLKNDDDPERISHQGTTHKKEQLHSELMTQWVKELDPSATEAQLIAARANHLRRWELARSDYTKGRKGYLQWRKEQAKRHSDLVREILEQVKYEEDVIVRVGEIIEKKNLKSDAQIQTHEDALCLVFLETQQDSLMARLLEEEESGEAAEIKLQEILEKTFKKMSPVAIQKAQKYL